MNVRIPATATAIFLALAAPATAEIITVEYTAAMGNAPLTDPPPPGWPSDVTVHGVYTFDSAAFAEQIGPGIVRYPVLTYNVELVSPSVGTLSLPLEQAVITIMNDLNGVRDSYSLSGSPAAAAGGVDFATIRINHFTLDLFKSAPAPNPTLPDTSLPLSDDDIAGFSLATDSRMTVHYLHDEFDQLSADARLSSIDFVNDESPILATECVGFKFPFAQPVTLPRKVFLPLLLRANLVDEADADLGPETLTAPPVVSVSYNGTFQGGADPNEFVRSVLRPTAGNAFVWNDAATTRIRTDVNEWQFALNTKPYAQPGIYTVSVMPGDATYAISPTCSQTFVRK